MYDWDLDYLSPLMSFVYVVLGRGGGRGGGMLRGGSPASSVAQAGNEERGQNVNYCPLPSTPFTACAHLLYARTPAACSCCGCLF